MSQQLVTGSYKFMIYYRIIKYLLITEQNRIYLFYNPEKIYGGLQDYIIPRYKHIEIIDIDIIMYKI